MYAKNGCPLMDPGSVDRLIQTVLPLATLLTQTFRRRKKLRVARSIRLQRWKTLPGASKLWGRRVCWSREAMPRAMPLTCCSMGNISIIIPPNAFLRKIRTAPVAPIPPQLRQIWRWGWICGCRGARKSLCHHGDPPCIGNRERAWANEPFL